MAKAANNRVRIIGGRHRGRRLPVLPEAGLRPSADRVRETLFNWLQPVVRGARCLDLFAGSGALGFEAASRDAEHVVMVDQAGPVANQLRSNVELFAMPQVDVVQARLPEWLMQDRTETFDIVFLDPPFDGPLMRPCCRNLQARGWLEPGALIYLEVDKRRGIPPLPNDWRLVKQKAAGRVAFYLVCSD